MSVTGRFAPSPSGRMHLGNLFAAVLSWLLAKKAGGRWILRIEDLDPQRSKQEYASLIIDDLAWLGLRPDAEPDYQSRRHHHYAAALDRLTALGLTFPCYCRRADIMASQAPHQADGRIVYPGTCRNVAPRQGVPAAVRVRVLDRSIVFTDGHYGRQAVNLAEHCGDFLLRRADGAWAYQLAVVVDDALMGVNQVVRGSDLLLSAAQQIYLFEALGYRAPQFFHIPLLVDAAGVRLSKRHRSLSVEALRSAASPEQILGQIAYLAGQQGADNPITLSRLLEIFDAQRIPQSLEILI